jgi:hypothetical protein
MTPQEREARPDFGVSLKVRLRLVPPEDGGRKTPIRSGSRPLSLIKDGNRTIAIGLSELMLSDELQPGSSGVGTLMFHRDVSEMVMSLLGPGSQFSLAEGNHIVASAEVLEMNALPAEP